MLKVNSNLRMQERREKGRQDLQFELLLKLLSRRLWLLRSGARVSGLGMSSTNQSTIVLLLNSSYKETRELPFAALFRLWPFSTFYVDLIRKLGRLRASSQRHWLMWLLRTSWSCA